MQKFQPDPAELDQPTVQGMECEASPHPLSTLDRWRGGGQIERNPFRCVTLPQFHSPFRKEPYMASCLVKRSVCNEDFFVQ